MTVHVTIELDEALKAKLDAVAEARRRTSSDIVAEAVRELVDEDDAFRAAVEQGLASARAGRLIPHEDVVAHVRARRALRARSA